MKKYFLFLVLIYFYLLPAVGQMSKELEDMLNSMDQNGHRDDDFLSLEKMMLNDNNNAEPFVLKDTLIRYNPIIEDKINWNKFNVEGRWRLVYKEFASQDMHIRPYTDPLEQRKCLNGELLFTNNFLYGTTTCLNNFLTFPEGVQTKTIAIDKAVNDDNLSPRYRYLYSALEERFELKNLNLLQFQGQAYATGDTYVYVVLNDSNMITFFDGYLFFLKKVGPVDHNMTIEDAGKIMEWPKDNRGYKMIIGKNTGVVYDFLDANEIHSDDSRARLHFIYFPPKLGQNYLSIHNLFINEKTGQMETKLLYSNKETLNNIKHIYINPNYLLSPFLRITLDNTMSKKYSWGIKYKLIQKQLKSKRAKSEKSN